MADGPVSETRVLLDGFGMGESPRWHEGRLWFSIWGANEIVAVDLEGHREVADGLAFPNGMAVTPDNGTLIIAESFAARLTAFDIAADGSLSNRRVWADVTGDGICIDAEGAVWCSAVGADGRNVVLRVREGGEVLDRIEVDPPCYACMLGGDDGRTLFMVVAQWFGPDRMDELIEAKTGQILTARVAVPHAGWP